MEILGVAGANRIHLRGHESVDLFRGSPDESGGIHQVIEGQICEFRRGFESLKQIIIATLGFDSMGGFHARGPDHLMENLSVASASACFQHQVFSRHEREFCCQVGLDHSVIDDEPAGDVLHDVECAIEGEKRL